MKKVFQLFLVLTLPVLAFISCGDDDEIKLKDITVNFASDNVGIGEEKTTADVAVNLSRTADQDFTVTIKLTDGDVVYGTDYTTTPAATNGEIKLAVANGETTAAVKITKKEGALFEGTETVKLQITAISATEGIVIGDKTEATVTFGAIVSKGDVMILEGKTEESPYANMVYVDFSNNHQIQIGRKSWNLGFYCGDEFRVFLNPTIQMAAAATSKSNIDEVGINDIEGLPNLVPAMMQGKFIGLNNVDDLKGALTKTAFAEISATDTDNKVYIVAMEGHTTSENYYKIKVSRSGEGYKVTYGLLTGTSTKTVEVAKEDGYNMVGVSFENNNTVTAEPEAKNWDIVWSYSTALTTMGGTEEAYFMQDIVQLNNLGGAEIAEIRTEDIKVDYPKFAESDLTGITFITERDCIGSEWRVPAKMGESVEPLGVRKDRFYVVKDPNGNIYKLKFNTMGINDDGERGRPEIEYALIKDNN